MKQIIGFILALLTAIIGGGFVIQQILGWEILIKGSILLFFGLLWIDFISYLIKPD